MERAKYFECGIATGVLAPILCSRPQFMEDGALVFSELERVRPLAEDPEDPKTE